MKKIIDKLYETNSIEKKDLLYIIDNIDDNMYNYIIEKAYKTKIKNYSKKVYMRGLIEFTNYCFRDCIYCGIRCSNENANRYRLSKDEILKCVDSGYNLGYKTFVLQGGEDKYFNDDVMVDIISSIKNKYLDCAITLSIGERSYDSYKKMYKAGADRYLLRHETINKKLYEKLHPNSDLENRIRCLKNLKNIGYQVGCGFMVGLPNQSNEDLADDLLFIKSLNPHMCGIGPFIPHKDTPLKDEENNDSYKTILMLAITRLLVPDILLPATTALSTIDNLGREKGLKAGANVVMPNLSPNSVRNKYSLYNGKVYSDDEDANLKKEIEEKIINAGFEIDMGRGDNKNWVRR